MNQLLQLITTVPPWLTYPMLGLLAFGESAAFVGLVLPGGCALLVGGVLAGTGRFSLPIVVAVAVVSAIAGDSPAVVLGGYVVGASWQRRQGVLGHITCGSIGAAIIGVSTVVVRRAKQLQALTRGYARRLVATATSVMLAAGVGQVAAYR